MNKEIYFPVYGSNYYYISHCIGCKPSILKRQYLDNIDEDRAMKGLCFKTKKQAENELKLYLKKLKSI